MRRVFKALGVVIIVDLDLTGKVDYSKDKSYAYSFRDERYFNKDHMYSILSLAIVVICTIKE